MNRASKLKLGGFVAASLAGLAALVIIFGGTPRLFDTRASYVVTFSEAPGVVPSVPVRKSGVRIGEVTAIDLDPVTGKVRVTIAVDHKYLPRGNEEATIVRGLLTNDTSLDFVPRTGPDGQPVVAFSETVPPNTEIGGTTPISPNQLVRQASGVLPTAQESILRILNSLERVERVVPKMEKAFDEVAALARSGREFVPELRRTNDKVQSLITFDGPKDDQGVLRSTLKEFRDFVKEARPLVEDIRKLVKDNSADITGTVKAVRQASEGVSDLLNDENRKALSATIKNFETTSSDVAQTVKAMNVTLSTADKTIKNINDRVTTAERVLREAEKAFKSIEGATKPVADNADAILKNVAGAADALSKTLVEVRTAMAVLNRGEGTFQRILADPSLYNNLNASAVSLNQTLMRADKIAQDLQVFSDKIARRPEIIGVGGALRPSSGLKDAPCASTGPMLPPSILDVPTYKLPEPIPPTR